MKIAVAGKGGSGKTTIAGTLARILAARGHPVVAVDDDSNPNLSVTVGAGSQAAAAVPPLPRDLLEERVNAQGDRRLELTVPAEEILRRYGVAVGERRTRATAGLVEPTLSETAATNGAFGFVRPGSIDSGLFTRNVVSSL